MNNRWYIERVYVTNILDHLIQDSIEQTPDGCAFAAVTRQIEYDLRNTYIGAQSPESIQTSQLFDHKSWDTYVKCKVLTAPLVGVFVIKDDYDEDGKAPYLGEGRFVKTQQNENATHAVVLVGLARDKVTMEEYFIYQNSHGDANRSLLSQNLSCVRMDLIVEVYESFSTPPAALVRNAQYVQHFLQLEEIGRQQRRQDAASLARDPNRHVGVEWTQFHEPPPFELLDAKPQPPPPQG